jgi:hypothetical protein
VTPFARILTHAVAATPGAIGGAFAAADGELVDAIADGDAHEWALITAHYGVILANLEAWLATKYFGGPRHFVVANRELDVAVHTVDDGYYVLMAMTPPSTIDRALGNLAAAARDLRKEMQ